MAKVDQIIKTVGRAYLREAFCVTDTAISNASARKSFPAKWYRLVKFECDRLECECPMDLFNFKKPRLVTAETQCHE